MMVTRDQPSNGGEGIANGPSFDTIEEAIAANAKRKALEEWLLSLPSKERAEWFALNSGPDGRVNIDELE